MTSGEFFRLSFTFGISDLYFLLFKILRDVLLGEVDHVLSRLLWRAEVQTTLQVSFRFDLLRRSANLTCLCFLYFLQLKQKDKVVGDLEVVFRVSSLRVKIFERYSKHSFITNCVVSPVTSSF